MAFIELKDVSFTYPNAPLAAIKNASLKVERGQFVVLFGASGSGKSTLLRLLKKDIQPNGDINGDIIINGKSIVNSEFQNDRVGFVFQDPENQLVADDVLHEIVFGLENSGLSSKEMRSRVAEMVHYFGAESLLERKTHELSGGMKQQINLASVLLMQPDLLLLDEPTSQLDPVSAREFLDMLVHLNEEFGMTIIMAEHRLDEVFTLADKIVMMKDGNINHVGKPRDVIQTIWDSPYRSYVPSIPSLYLKVTKKEGFESGMIPLSVKEGRNWLNRVAISFIQAPSEEKRSNHQKLLEIKELSYRYQKEDDFVLKDVNFSLYEGEIYSLLGGNGSGKSTLLKTLAGILNPNRGKITILNQSLKAWKKENQLNKWIGYLPQNPKIFFIHDTVEKEIQEAKERWGISETGDVNQFLNQLDISHLLNKHPYDLSGGEQQKVALACVLIRKPKILLLDEPTKGIDPISKDNLAKILMELQQQNISIMMSTHDVEFAAMHSTRCGMMFQGNITSENNPKDFFKGNFFYTTMVQRVFRNMQNNEVVTLGEAVGLCQSTEKQLSQLY